MFGAKNPYPDSIPAKLRYAAVVCRNGTGARGPCSNASELSSAALRQNRLALPGNIVRLCDATQKNSRAETVAIRKK